MENLTPEEARAVVVGLVTVLWPLVVAALRRYLPGNINLKKAERMVLAAAGAFAAAFVATPGTLQEKVVAGVLAALGSQGVYNVVRVARG